jgi:hypothetical protein
MVCAGWTSFEMQILKPEDRPVPIRGLGTEPPHLPPPTPDRLMG